MKTNSEYIDLRSDFIFLHQINIKKYYVSVAKLENNLSFNFLDRLLTKLF